MTNKKATHSILNEPYNSNVLIFFFHQPRNSNNQAFTENLNISEGFENSILHPIGALQVDNSDNGLWVVVHLPCVITQGMCYNTGQEEGITSAP